MGKVVTDQQGPVIEGAQCSRGDQFSYLNTILYLISHYSSTVHFCNGTATVQNCI